MSIRERIEELEKETLHAKACLSSDSKGRERPEKFHSIRTAFQRDRDRIIHCKSFRRLKHKTQVFMAPFGDHYRTRLTHTLEVSQIARTMAKALRLNEDLTEAIALGHDLGHTHYEQSLRVVEQLEYEGKGLNLTYEVRDGIFKHSKGKGAIQSKNREDMPDTLEGQLVRASDVIAYVNHDIDDAVRAGVIKAKDIPEHLVAIFGKWYAYRIDKMVEDVVESSLKSGLAKITMSKEIAQGVEELREFLYKRVYFNPTASVELRKTEKIMTDLFTHLMDDPGDLIKPYPESDSLERRVGDAIAGMTDLYALRLYEKFFFPRSWPVL